MNESDVLTTLSGIAITTLGIPAGELDDSANLLELGLDSLMLIKFGQEIERRFGVKLEMAWFFKNMPSLRTLAGHVASIAVALDPELYPEPKLKMADSTGIVPAASLSSATDTEIASTSTSTFDDEDDALISLFHTQTEMLEDLFDKQLSFLASHAFDGSNTRPSRRGKSRIAHDIRGFRLDTEDDLTSEQETFIDSVITHHVSRTLKSRALTQKYRHELADWKNTLSFRKRLKEAIYPIMADGSNGAHFTDIDGNDYIDIALGMGVNFMGHRHPIVVAAVEKRLRDGFELGPQCNMTGRAAELVSCLTGMERVCFCNTGSEAVMAGLRLARAKTGRMKVVVFNGAYHGIFDGVLGAEVDGKVEPLSPGTPPGMVEDIVMLDYDSPASLAAIERMAENLAAVLVEPVQSRRPSLQPQTFLRRLRKLTREKNIALIFDEMVNGFRIAPGGAQEYFGIRADIALYGKTIGGGLPVGIIAGSADYLDLIDGGFWQYGDESLPSDEAVVFGGTFCRHPFSMEAVAAVAGYMLEKGSALQDRISRLAGLLADELNLWFQEEQVPLRIARFGSQFRFESYGPWTLLANPIELDLFFLMLTDAGVYTWERRTCCLSVAHTENDIRAIIRAVRNAIKCLRDGGFPFRLERGAPAYFHDATSVQKRIYAAMQGENGQAPYHMPSAWRIRGDLDIERLECSLGDIIRRHECLRSGFRIAGGRLVRTVVDEPRFFIEHIVPDGRSPEQIIDSFIRPFDLECPPLLRVGIVEFEDGSSLLVFDSLHIVVDGIALATLTRELNALYNDDEPPDAGASYSQYELFMREFEASGDCTAQRAYWSRVLADAPLPVTFSHIPESTRHSQKAGHIRTIIDTGLRDRIRKTAASCGVTPYMFLLAVYSMLLRSFGGISEMVVGVATTGRPGKRFEATIGMFVNTLPLRLKPHGDQTFREFLVDVRDVCAEAYQHQEIPYELIAEKTGDTVGTMFTYETADDRSLDLVGIESKEMTVPIPGAMFDFSLDAIEKNDVVHLDFEFDLTVLEEQCVRIWADCFCGLIESVCTDPDVPISSIPFATRNIADTAFFRLDGETRDYNGLRTIIDLFDNAVQTHSNAAAVIDADGIMTYAGLDTLSRRMADRLASDYGIGPNNLVGVCAPPSAALVAVIIGILRTGGAFLPFEHEAPKIRAARILETAGLHLLIGKGELFDNLESVCKTDIDSLQHLNDTRSMAGTAVPSPDSLAYVIYTSGSTGVPKGCEIEHGSLVNYVAWAIDYYFPENDTGNFCLTSPLAFDMSLMTLFVPLCMGATLRIPPHDANPAEALALAVSPETETDVLNLTPSHIRIIDGLGLKETNVRIAVSGGEKLHREDIRTLLDLNPAMKIYNEYGPTETTIGCTAGQIISDKSPTIGRPIANTTAYIVDADMRPLPPSAWGELIIGGKGLARGYRAQPDMTLDRFVTFNNGAERVYRTGDRARRTMSGDIELGGRLDEQLKIGGYRIEPGEIENALISCEGVTEAAVVYDNSLVAFVTGDCEIETIKRRIAELLPAYMVPQRIEKIDSLPVSSSGKIDRKTLAIKAQESAYEQNTDSDEYPVSPALAIMREIAGNPHMGQSDNFFSAGGNSLDAVAVVARCRKELGLNVGLREFFAEPTAETIMHSGGAESETGGLYHTSPSTIIPQTPGQKQIWFASQKADTAYNMTELFLMEGALDADLLRSSFAELVRRHEILRTTFGERGGELIQEVHVFTPDRSHFEVIDCLGDEDPERTAIDFADRESQFAFDLAQGPPMRVIVFHQDIKRHFCLLNIHHIVTDGWSATLMLNEVSRIYCSGGAISDQPEWQYRDYAAWHRTYLDGRDAEHDIAHWRSTLHSPLPRLTLPGRKHKTVTDKGHRQAGMVKFGMHGKLVRSLGTFAGENSTTLFITLLAGLAAVLYQRTSDNDLIIGTPAAGRVLPELETMPGYFLNTLPLRIHVDGETTFRTLLREATRSATDAFAYQLCPFDRLAETFDSHSADGRNPLFDIMLILQNTEDYRFNLPEVQSRRFHSPRSREAKFEIMIELETTPDGLGGVIEYDSSLYDKVCIEALAADYITTLETITETPDAAVLTLFTLMSREDVSSRERFIQSISDISVEF